MRKLLRLTSAAEFLPVLLVSLMALFTGLALLGASAWLVASAALMPPLYTLALGITTVRACGIGSCEGVVGFEGRGTNGFGYDPLFWPEDTPGKTMAELTPEEKNAISHRKHAIEALAQELAKLG